MFWSPELKRGAQDLPAQFGHTHKLLYSFSCFSVFSVCGGRDIKNVPVPVPDILDMPLSVVDVNGWPFSFWHSSLTPSWRHHLVKQFHTGPLPDLLNDSSEFLIGLLQITCELDNRPKRTVTHL